eukprot:2228910-Alexandrium_andersonii.AAC.1
MPSPQKRRGTSTTSGPLAICDRKGSFSRFRGGDRGPRAPASWDRTRLPAETAWDLNDLRTARDMWPLRVALDVPRGGRGDAEGVPR